MSIIVKLLLASLFSIHQYLPEDDARYKKYYTDVREATAEDIIPAAHETCRYLISVFVDAGLEETLGSSENKFLSNALAGILGSDDALNSILGIIDSGKFADKFAEHNINQEEVKTAVKNICSAGFSPLSFTPAQRKEVFDFIQSEIKVLSDVHLNSLGEFNYFGSVNLFDRTAESIGSLDAVPRAWVPYEKMSKNLTLTLLAAEDEDFFEHRGVNSKAIARILKQELTGDDATGGSTVTMQLLKNMYFIDGPKSKYEELNSGSFSTLLRKVREWYWAWPFEKEHAKVMGDLSAKKYVLELYYNLVEFGPRIQGVEQASYVYFNKSSEQLELAEAAFITTLLKAPSRYSNPNNYVEYSEPRRNDYILTRSLEICERVTDKTKTIGIKPFVLDLYERLCVDGKQKIDEAYIEVEKAKAMPLWLKPTASPVNDSLVLVRNQVSDWVQKFKFDPEKKPKEISVQTTINQKLQSLVFDVVKSKLDEYDGERNSINNVNAAIDDTGREAKFRFSDIDPKILAQAKSVTDKSKNKILKYFTNIKFQFDKSIYSHSIDFLEVKAYLDSIKVSDEDAQIVFKDLENELLKVSTKLGEVYVIEFDYSSFRLISIQDFINNELEIKEDEKQSLLQSLDASTIRNKMISVALQRLDQVKPRSFMKVGMLSDDRILIDSSLSKVELAQAHSQHLKSKKFKLGDFFWIRPDTDSNSKLYYLDSPKLQSAVVVMDSNTGEVLANFGGYDPLSSSFNRSKDALRQAGSTLKPWIYYYALNKGFNPQDTLNNRYAVFDIPKTNRKYVPKNYSSSLNGYISLHKSLVNSQNIGTYSLIQNPIWGPDWQTNLDELIQFFQQIELYQVMDNGVTIMLGSEEITVEKLVSSFTYFSNGSKIVQPQYVKFVTDYKGQNLFELKPQFTEVPRSKPGSLFQIQTMMAETANSGTAGRINAFVKNLSEGKYKESCYNDVIGAGKQTCFGGKTGTSNDAKDVWFIGLSKNFVIGVWIGYDVPQSIGSQSTGGGLALPIFQDIVSKGERLLPPIEPFITNEMIPRELEKRVMYGKLGCIRGSSEAVVTYSEIGSNFNQCGSGSGESSTSNQTEPDIRGSVAEIESTSAGNCTCKTLEDGRAGVTVVFQGRTYKNQTIYRNLAECERLKSTVETNRGTRVCQ